MLLALSHGAPRTRPSWKLKHEHHADVRKPRHPLWLDCRGSHFWCVVDHSGRYVDAGPTAGAASDRIRVVKRNDFYRALPADGGIWPDGPLCGGPNGEDRPSSNYVVGVDHYDSGNWPNGVRFSALATYAPVGARRRWRHWADRSGVGSYCRQHLVLRKARACHWIDDRQLGVRAATIHAGFRAD